MKLRRETKIGIFVVLVLAVSFAMTEYLKGKDMFSNRNQFYVCYETVDGIGTSTAVTIGGYDAGKVTSVTYNPSDRNYLLGISVSKEYEIPSDSRVSAYSSDILGTRKLKIVYGVSGIPAKSGDTLDGVHESDLITGIVSSFAPTKERIDSLLVNLDRTVRNLNSFMDENMHEEIDGILSNLSATAGYLNSFTESLSAASPDINRIMHNVDTLSETLKAAAVPIEGTIASAKSALDSIQDFILFLQNPDGSLGKLTTTDSLYNSIHSLTADLDSLVKRIEKDPKRYIKISVF